MESVDHSGGGQPPKLGFDGVNSEDIDLANRWRNFESAKGCRPHMAMRDHYSDIRLLIPALLHFSESLWLRGDRRCSWNWFHLEFGMFSKVEGRLFEPASLWWNFMREAWFLSWSSVGTTVHRRELSSPLLPQNYIQDGWMDVEISFDYDFDPLLGACNPPPPRSR